MNQIWAVTGFLAAVAGAFAYGYVTEQPWMNLFSDYAEFMIGFVVVTFIYLEYSADRTKEFKLQFRKEQTARYWVFHNALNRVNQDMRVLREITAQVRHAPKDCSAEQRAKALIGVFTGYREAWRNDDVLSTAMDFEFILLSDPEKNRILNYFEYYNTLEDYIAMTISSLQVDIEQGDIGARVLAECDRAEDQVRDLIREALMLMSLLQYADRVNPEFERLISDARARLSRGAELERYTGAPAQMDYGVKMPPEDPAAAFSTPELTLVDAYRRSRPGGEKLRSDLRKAAAITYGRPVAH